MKRKISSFITAMLVLFVCVFASACGDKYKNMEFQILYAFSADAKEWRDGTNGISLNYALEGEGDDSLLVFDENDEATVYVKVLIKNVKAKHVDSITLTTTSVSGLHLSSNRVKQDEVFKMKITGNINTTLKLYENNSGKSYESPLVVSRKLEAIVANDDSTPALTIGNSLNLLRLNNLTYFPISQTNQIGVKYSVDSIGCYLDTHEYVEKYSTEAAQDYLSIENGVLSVVNGRFFDDTAYVVKVRATSVYHDGSKEGTEPIDTVFDVYLVESNISNPVVKFDDIDGNVIKQKINIYENGGKYASSTFFVDSSELLSQSKYADEGLNTINGVAKYSVAIYVKTNSGKYEKYDFESAEHQEGVNGLIVKSLGSGRYSVSIANRNVEENLIRVVYEIEGLNFSFVEPVDAKTELKVVKGVMPTCITINDAVDMVDGDEQSATIYGTTSNTYLGLVLKLVANPNSDSARKILLADKNGGLLITDSRGASISSEVLNGSTVYVKFKSDVVDAQVLTIKTLVAPKEYNEQDISGEVVNNEDNYITVKYNLTKLVTADAFKFVENSTSATTVEEVLLNAANEDYIYVRVYYTGVNLETETIKLTSNNNDVVFKNGSTEMLLSGAEYLSTNNDGFGKYNVYAVPVKATNKTANAEISIIAGDGTFNVESLVRVSSVHLMTDEEAEKITVDATTTNVRKFDNTEVDNGAFNFAISKSEFAEFSVVDEHNKSNAIASIQLEAQENANENFSKNAVSINVISNSTFVATGRIDGKTEILKLTISYYSYEDGKIVLKTTEKTIQIAVYESIGNISATAERDVVGYVNPYYTEVSSTVIEFASYTSIFGSPANSVVFANESENIKVDGASKIQVNIGNYFSIKNSELVDIIFKSNEKEIDLLENNGTILTVGNENFLSGTILINVKGDVGFVNEISITLRALRFGKESNALTNVIIKVAKIDKAEKIVVSGEEFVQTSSTSNELQMSFMNVATNGYDEAKFNAELQFASLKPGDDALRFDDIATALTHVLYRYDLDEDGNPVYETNADGELVIKRTRLDSFLNVTYQNGVVNVKAFKNLGGGLFRLVLASKDSYNLVIDPTSINLEEENFDTTYAVIIRVEDGTKTSAYSIKTADELLMINFNLDKHFRLAANIDLTKVENLKPLGLIDTDVHEFTGSLNGEMTSLIGEEKTKTTSYSITTKVGGYVDTDVYGRLSGLFAIIGEGASVSNVQLNVKYANSFESTKEAGIKVGSLAAVNKGTIKNVEVFINSDIGDEIDFTKVTAGGIDFGGIVGFNESQVIHSRVENVNTLTIVSGAERRHLVGLIAGTNAKEASIVGGYVGKESLNNFVFDVVADVYVVNRANDKDAVYYIGGVSGLNNGSISGMLVGGNMAFEAVVDGVQTGAVAGIAGSSIGDGNKVEISTALALNINSMVKGIDVAGIIGHAVNTQVDTVKFVSVEVDNNSTVSTGSIVGINLVAGVIAKAEATIVEHASVESFIEYIYDEAKLNKSVYYTICGGETTAGLIAHATGVEVKTSFVRANILSLGNINLTTNITNEINTYFIGKVERDENKELLDNTTYSLVNGVLASKKVADVVLNIETYLPGTTVSNETTDWAKIYVKNDDGTYTKAESYEDSKAYVKFDNAAWETFVATLIDAGSTVWNTKEHYNVVNLNGVEVYFPMLLRFYDTDGDPSTIGTTLEPLMIVAPQAISANINANYVVVSGSVHVVKFNIEDYVNKITETVIVNYFNGASDEDNAHNLISKDNDGLLDVSILPEDSQGGYSYEILGDGINFAYINSKNQIVFTGASGQTPILVRIYSVFNPEIEVFVVFYSQNLLTKLELSASSIYYANEDTHKYEMNIYTGQSNRILALDAQNMKEGDKYSSILNVRGISQYLKVVATSEDDISKLEISTTTYDNIVIRIKEGEKVENEQTAIIKFTLFLDASYYGAYALEDIEIANVTLLVHMYNSATSIDIDGDDLEIPTNKDIAFKVRLTTDYVNEDRYTTSNIVENWTINNNGEIVLDVKDSDGIKIALNVVEGNEQVEELIAINGVEHFAQLFNIQIVSSLFVTEHENKVIGYKYDVLLELIDKHDVRYINDNIKFNIIVSALSNPNVNNVELGGLEILMMPTQLSTARIENYAVQSLNVYTDYTNIVTRQDIETPIVEPGSLGNVMMIYLEPTYSKVASAKIKSSSLYVPSLGKNVKMTFTQLVLDRNSNASGVFTTLYSSSLPTSGDELELQLVSEILPGGKKVYNGIVLVYVQLERFSGLEATITAHLEVETSNGLKITRYRELLTSYLPGTKVEYNEDRAIKDGYLVQKGTSNNEAKIKVYGYQFNSNPSLEFAWYLPTDEEGLVKGDYAYKQKTENGKRVDDKHIIVDGTGKEYIIGDYVSYYLLSNYTELKYDPFDDSYTISLKLNVAEDIPAAFALSATLSLSTKDGQLKTSEGKDNTIIFYPAEYLLNSMRIRNLVNDRKNIAINKTNALEFVFETDSEVNDLSETINTNLNNYIKDRALRNNTSAQYEMARLFSYYSNGQRITFADTGLYNEFEFNYVNEEIISITGIAKFNNFISFNVWFGYDIDENGLVSVNFGENGDDGITIPKNINFTLNIYPVNEENEIVIYSPDDLYDASTGTWNLVEGGHYVLVNDIELTNVTPITTKIGSFDGNNRVISIKSFMVNPANSNYGLFAELGTYSVLDQELETNVEKQTILKNMIVDYGKFEGTIALNNLATTEVVFGGLVAVNNGGLIYNCDVMNLTPSKDVNIDVIVASNSEVVFGGLAGKNNGIITNSRVGRDSYTRITATRTTESSVKVNAGGINFNIYNKGVENDDDANKFAVVAGGFVGANAGTISSSYVTKTNLTNYSTNETTNKTAAFAGENSGKISYCFTKADESTVSTTTPRSTGYQVEHKGNGIVAGFVYNNSGTIDNSYANIELRTKSAYIAGFVYSNTGTIKEAYAASKMNSNSGDDTQAEQPFVGVNKAGDLMSTGTLENTYYLMRSVIDSPYTQGDLDVAQGLNEDNFQNSEYLIGFSFVLSNSKAEREQGIWTYYTLENEKRLLPELMTANIVSHSYRYVVEDADAGVVLRNATTYAEGSANNPYTISSVEEFNNVFTEYGYTNKFVGYVRIINDIDFNDDKEAIATRANFVLGDDLTSSRTSVEGNGMTISGIYLDAGEAIVEKIGLFAEIKNAYVKNLNLEFATPTTDGKFSTSTATYSGGLAGKIHNSAIINTSLIGSNTTLTGTNFVGGLAGLVSGNSLISGVETNLNVMASGTEDFLYYSESDYKALNIQTTSYCDYETYIKKLSYAGAVAGVLDLNKKSNVEYNVQFVDVRGDLMPTKIFAGRVEANILAQYAGGVAGYASKQTSSYKLRYFMGSNELIRGDVAVGGLYGVGLGDITASQVAAEEDLQFVNDTNIGKYITALQTDETAKLGNDVGNLNLLESYKYAGGLIGVGLNSSIRASYSKASIKSGEIVGGIVGLSVASSVNYSYAIPYVNIVEETEYVGGLIGAAYGILPQTPTRNSEIASYEALLKLKGVVNASSDVQFTYSTIITDNAKLKDVDSAVVIDYVSANYQDSDRTYLQSNSSENFTYVYAGTVNYYKKSEDDFVVKNQTKATSKSAVIELYRLYNVGDSDQVIAFQEVFAGWSLMKYWSLKEEKYFPLLNNESVDNFIDLDDESDFAQISANPSGKYRVVKDIYISPITTTNWVISGTFTGVLIGEIEGDSRRPTITIGGLSPVQTNETTGFFQSTYGATISNLAFEWTCTNEKAIDISGVSHITMASGLTCQDTNSLISNIEVKTSYENARDGYIINEDISTIGGFGGVVGTANNTNILGCKFIGKVNAKLKGTSSIYVGGLVGLSETVQISGEEQSGTGVINSANVGVKGMAGDEDSDMKYSPTGFNLTVDEANTAVVYIGAAVGRANNVAIASVNVGGVGYDVGYENIPIEISVDKLSKYMYVGGVVGFAVDGMVSNCQTLNNINVYGSAVAGSQGINVGGLAGLYNLTNPTSTSGVSGCQTISTIKTLNADKTSILTTPEETLVKLSTGVAEINGGGDRTMRQCLFTGEVNTEGADIQTVYAGGAVALVTSGTFNTVDLEEITTNTALNVGCQNTEDDLIIGTLQLYVGGLVGQANKINISYSSSLGRVVPITSVKAEKIYAGGLIGEILDLATVNNSYTISTIVADSISSSAIQKLNVGGLVGAIPNEKTVNDIIFSEVYYSSDYALFADENYVGAGEGRVPLGTNLSAQALLYSDLWQNGLTTEDGDSNSIWSTFKVGTQNRLPYLTALEEEFVEFGILAKRAVGSSTNDYREGSAMRPFVLLSNGEYTFDTEYTYYILQDSGNLATPTFNGELVGILFGQDLAIDSTFTLGQLNTIDPKVDAGIDETYFGVIPAVAKHSAVSNLNINLGSNKTISVSGVGGLLVGVNNGMIFNSSIQGNGIKIDTTSTTNMGLIVGKNNGMVSHCYSTVEIIETKANLAGIAHTNNGKLLSNYFTGYIEGKTQIAGIVCVSLENSYAYNNYMAGVIKTENAKNAFSATEFVAGSNNYLDTYSDMRYYNYYYNELSTDELRSKQAIHPATTSELMTAEKLDGEWHVATTGKSGSVKLNAGSVWFGHNYNYPIYRFNKKQNLDSEKYEIDDWKNQLYTGTGGISKGESTDSKGLQERFEYLVANTQIGTSAKDTQYYHAFKVPHLGVLTSIQSLLDEESSRNFVLIYDIDGQYDNNKYIDWTAVGRAESDAEARVNGFVTNNKAGLGFNGVFISNKYYAHNMEGEVGYCLVTNLQGNGLFDNIGESYFANIKFGNFYNLKESGALGKKIIQIPDANGTKIYSTVHNIILVRDSDAQPNTISGANDKDDNYYGALFGLIEGNLIVDKFVSHYGNAVESGIPSVQLKSESSTTGLIAGKVTGTVDIKENEESSYYALFVGNNYAGGLIGELSGELNGNHNIIRLVNSKSDEMAYTKMLGGMVGKTTGTAKIDAVTVELYQINGAAALQYKTESFGGAVAHIASETRITNYKLQANIMGEEKTLNLNGELKQGRYYGLLVGLQAASLTSNFEMNEDAPIEKMAVTCSKDANFDESSNQSGVGLLVGAYKNIAGSGDAWLHVTNYKSVEFEIEVLGVPNVGGFVGYFSGPAKFNINAEGFASGEGELAQEEPDSSKIITIIATTNVGGLIGKLEANIGTSGINVESGSVDFFNTSTKFAKVIVNGSKEEGVTYRNFGGLFGVWNGSNVEGGNVAKILNNNSLDIGFEGSAVYNVGGIAGKISSAELSGLTNTAELYESSEKPYSTSHYRNGTSEHAFVKLVNVGGIAGYASSPTSGSSLKATNMFNIGIVGGYQNVGGVFGYAGKNVEIVNTNSISAVESEEPGSETKVILKPKYNTAAKALEVDAETELLVIEDVNLPKDKDDKSTVLKGRVYGVLNVGGLVGYAGEGVAISQVFSMAKVYGNANVGGLVGFANNAKLTNNYLYSDNTDAANTSEVKGIYYISVETDEEDNYTEYAHIPTSVGGLVGTSSNSILLNNIIDQVKITSTQEAGEGVGSTPKGVMIDTVSNKMADVSLLRNDSFADYISATVVCDLEKQNKVDFNEIKTGFGGFVGTLDVATVKNSQDGDTIKNNTLNKIDINAQLGIHVGTYYGVYVADKDFSLDVPELYGDIFIDGGYNVGGVLGFAKIGDGTAGMASFASESLQGHATINLQSRVSGVYIGGLLGRTQSNQISDLVITSGNNVDVKISSNSDYYVGGLIGRAELTQNNAKITGSVGKKNSGSGAVENYSILAEGQDDRNNFGGLIGVLKLGQSSSGLSVTVKGDHMFPFTVNVIENMNYYDGDARFNENQEGEATVYAEAFYVNKDSFTISGSLNKSLYDAVDDVNPLNSNAHGWSKQYTAFRQVQRVIPQDNHWDSLATIYDAAQVTHVGTIANLGLKNVALPGRSSDWDTSCTKATNARLDVENNQITLPAGATEEQKQVYESLTMVAKVGENYYFNENHICFTIYEQADKTATLYSAIGIGTAILDTNDAVAAEDDIALGTNLNNGETFLLYNNQYHLIKASDRYTKDWNGPFSYDWKQNASGEFLKIGNTYQKIKAKNVYVGNTQIYAKPPVDIAKWYEWIGGFFLGESPSQAFYIDMNGNSDLQGLTYLDYSNDKDWRNYNTLQADGTSGGGKQNLQNGSGATKMATYFVKDYLKGDPDYAGDTTYNGNTGAYFVFDVLYDNGSLNGLGYKDPNDNNQKVQNATDETLPSSGSIFEVSGIYSSTNEEARLNKTSTDWFGIIANVVSIIIDVVIIAATWGMGGALTAGKAAAKHAAKGAVKAFIKAAGKHIVRKVAKTGVKKLLKRTIFFLAIKFVVVDFQLMMREAKNAYIYYIDPSPKSFGFLSQTYSRYIGYQSDGNGGLSLIQESDYAFTKEDGTSYYYFSSTRPSDYHTQKYLGVELNVEDVVFDDNDNPTSIIEFKTTGLAVLEGNGSGEVYQMFADAEFMWKGNASAIEYDENNAPAGTTVEHIGSKTTLKQLQENIKNKKDNEKITLWQLENKYEMKNGQYYINSKVGEITTYRALINLDDDEPNIVYGDSNIHARGKFNSSTGYYYENGAYAGNNLTIDEDDNYSINGKEFAKETVEYAGKEFSYVRAPSVTVSNGKYVINDAAGNPKETHYEGYGVFSHAYLTMNGNSNLGVKKYATFTKVNSEPSGQQGVHWYSQGMYQPNDSGIYKQLEDGSYILAEDGYKGQRFEYVTIYYALANTSFVDTEFVSTESTKCVPVYPGTFKNPYASYAGIGNSAVDNCAYVWTSTSGDDTISFAPTYYLYEGGYIVDEEDLKDATVKYPMVYVPLELPEDEAERNKILQDTLITIQKVTGYSDTTGYQLSETETKISYQTLINDWSIYGARLGSGENRYDQYYLTDYQQPLTEIFNVKNGQLYMSDSNYTLDQETKLLARIGIYRDTANKDNNLYKNFYLTNKECGLYTRYRYVHNGSISNLKDVWELYAIVPSDKNPILNDGKVTRFVESSKVILCGNGNPIRLRNGSASKYENVNSFITVI